MAKQPVSAPIFVSERRIRAAWLVLLAVAAALLSLLWGAPRAHAQGLGGAKTHVQWTTDLTPPSVTPGATARLTLDAKIDEGWKMYALDSPPPSQAVEVHFDELPAGLSQKGKVTQTEPREGYDPAFQTNVSYFKESARLRADIAVGERAAAGERTISGRIRFMVCDPEKCLPPTDKTFTAALAVQSSNEQSSNEQSSGEASSVPVQTGGGGLWGFILLAAGAGLAALLTPCVFPMIPLTVSYFTKHSGTRQEAVRMAGVYGLTVVMTFTGLGLLTALLVGAAGAQTIAANPWINLFIGGIFVVFALSLLGLFELRLPGGLLNRFNRQSNERTGYTGVFFMGLTLTLVSFSCTVPFVGGLLAATAGGAWRDPIIGMLVFSAVFSLPFVLFALFPRGLDALPSSGQWMGTLKGMLGFVELAAALKFLSNADLVWGTRLLSRPLAIALVSVIFFLAGLYLLGKLRLGHEPGTQRVGAGRLLTAVAFFGLSLYLIPGLLGAPLGRLDAYLPPRQAGEPNLFAQRAPAEGEAASETERFQWHTDDKEAAFAQARKEGKPVFIDFTGYTCTNCRDMEANVFPKPQVARRLQNRFVLLRLFTDDPETGTTFQRYQLRLTGTTALPTYAVVHPDGGTLITRTSGMTPPDEFVSFLDGGASAFAEADAVADRPEDANLASQ